MAKCGSVTFTAAMPELESLAPGCAVTSADDITIAVNLGRPPIHCLIIMLPSKHFSRRIVPDLVNLRPNPSLVWMEKNVVD